MVADTFNEMSEMNMIESKANKAVQAKSSTLISEQKNYDELIESLADEVSRITERLSLILAEEFPNTPTDIAIKVELSSSLANDMWHMNARLDTQLTRLRQLIARIDL